MALFCGLVLFAAGNCAAKELSSKVFVFVSEPMGKTDWEAYPEANEIYDSDGKLLIVGRKELSKEGDYTLSVKIQNAAGETIYSHDEKQKTRGESGKDIYILFKKEIELNQDFKAKLTEKNTINIYCDNQLFETKPLLYTKKSMLNSNIKQIVILPFFSDTNDTLHYQYRDMILNTFSDAINCEIRRISAEVVPSYISAQKISDLKIKDCLKDSPSRERLKNLFGADVYVLGNVRVPKYTHEAFEFRVWVINVKTGKVEKFQDSVIDESERFIEPKMRKMIFNVLYKKGLVAYLSGL